MPSLINTWVSYVNRSYEQIKASVVARLQVSNPEITDYSETNILVILISIFSGIGEMLNYYIDNMAREAYIATARRLVSVINLVKILDYRVKAAYPASADILITFDSATLVDQTIPSGTIFTSNTIPYVTLEDLFVPAGTTLISVGVSQIVQVSGSIIGETDGSPNQVISLGQDYVHDSISLTINSVVYTNVESFAYAGPEDKYFIVEVDATLTAFIIFGDGINGAIPPLGYNIIADYSTTQGTLGNVLATTINTNTTISDATFSNPLAASGGTDYQDIESIRKLAPLSIRTLYRAVTKQDYKDIALMASGVAKAEVKYCCGKEIDIYIGPNGGGIASSILLQNTKDYIDAKKMITTKINMVAAGSTYLIIDMEIFAAFRIPPATAEADVRAALLDEWSYDNQDINQAVRISDLVALVDNLPRVDHLTLTGLRTVPYANPLDHDNPLIWQAQSGTGATSIISWRLVYDGTDFVLYKDSEYLTILPINFEYTDSGNNITLKILAGVYDLNNHWDFKTYPYLKDIELCDYTVPVLTDSLLTLTVSTQSSVNCNTNC